MSARRFYFAVCLAASNVLCGVGFSMLLHLKYVWPGPLMVSGATLALACIVPERGQS